MTTTELIALLQEYPAGTEIVIHREEVDAFGVNPPEIYGEEIDSVFEVGYNRVFSPTGQKYAKVKAVCVAGLWIKEGIPKFLKVKVSK
jgi:hypothetical protein